MFDGLQWISLMGLAGFLEAAGGALLLIGLFARPVAFILCGFMAVAYFMAHASQGSVLLPMLNEGELAVLYCFVLLYRFSRVRVRGVWTPCAAARERGRKSVECSIGLSVRAESPGVGRSAGGVGNVR